MITATPEKCPILLHRIYVPSLYPCPAETNIHVLVALSSLVHTSALHITGPYLTIPFFRKGVKAPASASIDACGHLFLSSSSLVHTISGVQIKFIAKNIYYDGTYKSSIIFILN